MSLTLPRQKFLPFSFLALIAILMGSCGSYQQASYYDDDGIYANGTREVRVEKRSAEAVRTQQVEDDIYGEYFGQKAQEYSDILDSEIFTDVDDYYGGVENDSILGEQTDYFADNNTYTGNPGWGDNPTSVSINVYGNGGFGWGGRGGGGC